jgi:glycosyltransferase involved in cell wall biosynthesis
MRIAVVLNTSWNIYNFRRGLIRSFLEKGHEVYTVAPEDDYSVRLVEEGCRFEKVTMDSRGANPIKDFLLIFELLGIYRRIKPDIILHFTIKPNIYGTLAARILNIPSINNVCGLGTVFLKKNIVSFIAVLLYKIAFGFANKIFFQNYEDRDLFLEKKLVDREKVDLIPGSGINLDEFLPQKYPDNKKFTFLLISRLIYDKGILEYVEAIERLKAAGIEARFEILGAVDYKHKRGIQPKVIYKWLRNNLFEYLGRKEDVRPFIKSADCIVLPSYREGIPRTLLEAASMARPIIATDVAGCRQVVIDGHNGYLCKRADSKDLADKMLKIYRMPVERRKAMGIKGNEKIQCEFDENLVIDKYLGSINIDKKAV